MPLISGGGGRFNGGTITGALAITPAVPTTPLVQLISPDGQSNDVLAVLDQTGGGSGTNTLELFPGGGLYLATVVNGDIVLYLDGQSAPSQTADILRAVDKNGHVNLRVSANDGLGFYGHAAATQQTLTSATATPEQIALALQANGLCGGT